MPLVLTALGATPAEIARGLAAAMKVIEDAGFDVFYAVQCAFDQECWNPGDEALTRQELDAAFAWREAKHAALEASGALNRPGESYLEWHDEDRQLNKP